MTDTGTARPPFGFLDLMVLIAESWIALILIPLCFAAAAFFLVGKAPAVQESYADVAAPPAAMAMVATAPFLEKVFADDRVVAALGPELDEIKAAGAANFRLETLGTGNATRVATSSRDGAAARALVEAVIANLPADIIPPSPGDERLRKQIEIVNHSTERLEQTLAVLNESARGALPTPTGTAAAPDYPQAYADAAIRLIDNLAEAEANRQALEAELADNAAPQPLVLDRSLNTPVRNAVIFAAFVGIILVLAVQFSRESLRNMRADPATQAKLERIRRAFRPLRRGQGA
ncbi:hypothetical protein [Devosia sp.]|uniref:hypothetical protein n=1 Tax=Devosia sp. TaxID=1871048 RepID=UPI002AFEE36B|nr:hypothetical protein [Devosia sp.]